MMEKSNIRLTQKMMYLMTMANTRLIAPNSSWMRMVRFCTYKIDCQIELLLMKSAYLEGNQTIDETTG